MILIYPKCFKTEKYHLHALSNLCYNVVYYLEAKVRQTLNKNIDVQTKQVLKQNGEKQKFEFAAQGSWQKKNADYIRYQEQIEDAVVDVTIKIEERGVKLIRKGDINMNLHFVEGHDTTTLYDIPAGRIPLTVKTRSILHFVNENGGKLKIQYELHQNDEKMGSYQYEIKYKEIGE